MSRKYTKTAEPAGKIRNSIANKLQRKMFFRLLGLFFAINIFVCIIFASALTIYFGSKLSDAYEALSDHGPPVSDVWASLSGISIRSIPDLTHYSHFLDPLWRFTRFLPNQIESTFIGFRAVEDGFRNSLLSITKAVGVSSEGILYEIELHIGFPILYFVYSLFALFAIELLFLLGQVVDDRRMVRKTLDPISELARAAQSLNAAGKQIELEKMMQLAGRLDGIDAGQLDTRIQVDDMQEELKNVAVAINGMLNRINESYATQARFVSDASHELRTPIAVIQGYANLLDRWGKEDETTLSESVSAIKDEAANMKELVEQLLFLARGDSNRISLIEERVDLNVLIDEVVGEMRLLGNKHSFKVSADGAVVLADRALIKQALRILTDNAIKYTDMDGEITISAERESSLVRLSVTDNGIGISPNILPHVFDRFVRADESRARATGGAGLGLSIAQWIAARHNGHLEVLSREGIGTRITLSLPAWTEAEIASTVILDPEISA